MCYASVCTNGPPSGAVRRGSCARRADADEVPDDADACDAGRRSDAGNDADVSEDGADDGPRYDGAGYDADDDGCY